MTKLKFRIAMGVSALAVAAMLVSGAPSPGQPPEKAPAPRADVRKETDPTQPGPGLKDILTAPKENKTAQPKTAGVRMKGRVISKQTALVVLDIDGASYILPVGGEARSVRVLEISATGVKVEIESGLRKETRVLHCNFSTSVPKGY